MTTKVPNSMLVSPGTGGGTVPFAVLTTDYGAVGDGVTNDTAAVTAAEAGADKIYVPTGTYLTTDPAETHVGVFWGEGQIKDSSANKRAPNFSHINTAPSSLGNHGNIETSFNGDLSKCQFPIEHRITGASTLGNPTTGYTYTPEAFATYTAFKNSSGHNQSTSGNDGRTGAVAHFTTVHQAGQGDAFCYVGRAWVNSTKAGSTDFLANPAGVLFAGDVSAGIAGAYMNPVEINCIDNGYDAAGCGAVFNMSRTNNTKAKKVLWNGVRVQSVGTKPIDSGYFLSGYADAGLDFTRATFTTAAGVIKPAMVMKDGDCIVGNGVAGSTYSNFTLNTNTALFGYYTDRWVLQTGGNPTFQATSTQAVVGGELFVTPVGYANRFSVTGLTTTVKNAFAHQGSTFGVFNATPQVQYPGWGTPTGYTLQANFPGASATLAQCGNAIGVMIAYFKAVGFFAA